MDSAFIHQAANELVQNVGTRNIKQIARSCSLDISETSHIKDMLGLFALIPYHISADHRSLPAAHHEEVCDYSSSIGSFRSLYST